MIFSPNQNDTCVYRHTVHHLHGDLFSFSIMSTTLTAGFAPASCKKNNTILGDVQFCSPGHQAISTAIHGVLQRTAAACQEWIQDTA